MAKFAGIYQKPGGGIRTREEVAQMRMRRLNSKLDALEQAIKDHPKIGVSVGQVKSLEALIKQRRNCLASRKKWTRELGYEVTERGR